MPTFSESSPLIRLCACAMEDKPTESDPASIITALASSPMKCLISCIVVCCVDSGRTSQITGGKKQSEERAALFAVRVHLPC